MVGEEFGKTADRISGQTAFDESITGAVKGAGKTASYDYSPMFQGLLADYPDFKGQVSGDIKWARSHLRKRDRVTWYLRWIRLGLYAAIAEGAFTHADKFVEGKTPAQDAWRKAEQPKPDAKPYDLQMVEKYTKLAENEQRIIGQGNAAVLAKQFSNNQHNIRNLIDHYLSLPVEEIQEITFDKQSWMELFSQFKAIEDAWKDETKGVLRPQPGDKPVLTFGGGWAWWYLDRGYDEDEARAMRHCGNAGGQYNKNERILSLRKTVKRGSREYLEPHLTFILNIEDNSLGEMKGKGNDKPTVQYHPYIIKLLESDLVDRIRGGGYLPTHNFKLGDLTEEEMMALADKKPSFANFYIRLKKEGKTSKLINDVKDVLGISDLRVPVPIASKGIKEVIRQDAWMPKLDGYAVNWWRNPGELAEEIGNDDAKYVAKIVQGDYLDYDPESSAIEALNNCSDETLALIRRYLAYKYPMQAVHWLMSKATDYEEMAKEFSDQNLGGVSEEDRNAKARKFLAEHVDLNDYNIFGDSDNILRFMQDNDLEEEEGNLRNAASDATRSGAKGEMSKAFAEAMKDWLGTRFPWGTIPMVEGNDIWDSPIYEVLPFKEAITLADSGVEDIDQHLEDEGRNSGDMKLEVSSPYYGWSGFDEGYCDERVKEEFSFKEDPEQPEQGERK